MPTDLPPSAPLNLNLWRGQMEVVTFATRDQWKTEKKKKKTNKKKERKIDENWSQYLEKVLCALDNVCAKYRKITVTIIRAHLFAYFFCSSILFALSSSITHILSNWGAPRNVCGNCSEHSSSLHQLLDSCEHRRSLILLVFASSDTFFQSKQITQERTTCWRTKKKDIINM